MRESVVALLAMGELPPESVDDEALWSRWEDAVRAVTQPAEDDEAAAVLGCFPRSEQSSYGLAWHLLHFVESSPTWPRWELLDDRSPWVTFLRERAERGTIRPSVGG